tara:strand:- start:613 stop:1563 length:951 start_codon:yes stop_codon:yes gene_type:complete
MSKNIDLDVIKSKLLHIFDFTETLWREYNNKHNELEIVMATLNKVVPIVQKVSKKHSEKKNCDEEINDVLQHLLLIVSDYEKRIDFDALKPQLEQLLKQQKEWKQVLEKDIQPKIPEVKAKEVKEHEVKPVVEKDVKKRKTGAFPYVEAPDFLAALKKRKEREVEGSDKHNYVILEDLDNIDYDKEIELGGRLKDPDKKITQVDVEKALKENNLELCENPECPLEDNCRVRSTIDVPIDDRDIPVKVIGSDGFCVRTKKTLRGVNPEIPASERPQITDIFFPKRGGQKKSKRVRKNKLVRKKSNVKRRKNKKNKKN